MWPTPSRARRPSAAEALSHPWLGGRGGRLRVVSPALANATRAVGDVVGDVVTNSIPETPLTEASLATLDQDVYEGEEQGRPLHVRWEGGVGSRHSAAATSMSTVGALTIRVRAWALLLDS